MKLLMCGQEAGTHKDHQKALSYLALWQGSAHQTVPCRSTMIRKAAGKQIICKVSAQLTSMHLDPYQRCFCVSGSVFACNTFQILAEVLKLASWLSSWLEVLAWALVPFYFTCPIQSELNAERLSIRGIRDEMLVPGIPLFPDLHPTLTTTASLRLVHAPGWES